jgi:plastocyanin
MRVAPKPRPYQPADQHDIGADVNLTDSTQARRSHFLLGVATMALSLVLVACSAGASTTPSATQATSTQTAAGSGSGGSGAGDTNVMLMNFAFDPTTLTVPVGTTVTFVNMDPTEHTVTNGKDGKAADNAAFDKKVDSGQSVTVTFDKAGTFDVTCTIHPSMNMTVTVQ